MERLFPQASLSYLVFGCAKSGTTWMQRLLSAHPQLHCAETRLLGDYLNTENPSGIHISLEKFVGLLARHYYPPVTPDRSADFHKTLLFNLIDTIGQTSIRVSGKPIYGEKLTPFLGTAGNAVRLLAEYNPRLRFVNLVRDGRDVIVSGFVQRANVRVARGGSDAPEHRRLLEANRVSAAEFDFFLGMWTGAVRAGAEAARLFPAYMDLRYERLLEKPAQEAGRLLDFLGADASAENIRACIEAASFERLAGGRARGQEDRASFFRKGVAGDWRNWLTPEQVGAFNAAGGDLLDALGYPRT